MREIPPGIGAAGVDHQELVECAARRCSWGPSCRRPGIGAACALEARDRGSLDALLDAVAALVRRRGERPALQVAAVVDVLEPDIEPAIADPAVASVAKGSRSG